MRMIVILLLAASPCAAQTEVAVEVVDVAGERVYLSPGASAGLGEGASVEIDRERFRVAGVTARYAIVEAGDRRVAIGARGVASVTVSEARPSARRAAPAALESYRGAWRAPSLPSAEQHPDPVPLGGRGGPPRLRVGVSANGLAIIPWRGADPIGSGEVRARVYAQPFADVPFTIDADLAAQLWIGRDLARGPGAEARPYLRVRELQLAYGHVHDFHAALGRLRYAAATLGQLDGLRVQTPSLEGFTFAAFGGFIPDPESGVPRFDAGRFGLEAAYRNPALELRPVVTLVGHGSYFDGAIDERRLTAAFHLYPGESHVGGSIELSAFDADNPWSAPELDVTAASIDATLRFDWLRIGARASMRQPERSRLLAAAYEPAWLCSPNDARCESYGDLRFMAALDGGVEIDDVAVDGGLTLIHVGDRPELDQIGGFASFRVVRLLGWGHVEISAMASSGATYETYAISAGAGAEVIPEVFDLSLRYRPALSAFAADVDYFVEHLAGFHVLVRPVPELDLTLDADALVEREVEAVLVQLGAAYHGAW